MINLGLVKYFVKSVTFTPLFQLCLVNKQNTGPEDVFIAFKVESFGSVLYLNRILYFVADATPK